MKSSAIHLIIILIISTYLAMVIAKPKQLRMKALKFQNLKKYSYTRLDVDVKNTDSVCHNSKVRIFADEPGRCVGKPINKILSLNQEIMIDPKKISDEKAHLELHHHIYEEFLHLIDTYKSWYYSYSSSCCKGSGAGKPCSTRKIDEFPSTHCAEYKNHFLDVHQMLLKLKSEEKYADKYLKKKTSADGGDEDARKLKAYLSKKSSNSKLNFAKKKFKEISKKINEIGLPDLNGLKLKEFLLKYENGI